MIFGEPKQKDFATQTFGSKEAPQAMYMPYWFEAFAPCFPWIVPAIALSGLWIAKSSDDRRVQRLAERVFFAALMLVAGATLRTMIANDGCWLLHTASMGVMILGAIFPHAESPSIEHDGDMIFTEF